MKIELIKAETSSTGYRVLTVALHRNPFIAWLLDRSNPEVCRFYGVSMWMSLEDGSPSGVFMNGKLSNISQAELVRKSLAL